MSKSRKNEDAVDRVKILAKESAKGVGKELREIGKGGGQRTVEDRYAPEVTGKTFRAECSIPETPC